jgi:hypothetical protein
MNSIQQKQTTVPSLLSKSQPPAINQTKSTNNSAAKTPF